MKCIKCGKEMADATRFCPECGTASVSQSAQPVLSSQLGTATGTRDQHAKTKMIYPRNPPLSPHICWINLLWPGVAQLIHGQKSKGLLFIILTFILWIFVALVIPAILILGIIAISIVDAYMVGNTLKSGKLVGIWQFFPNP